MTKDSISEQLDENNLQHYWIKLVDVLLRDLRLLELRSLLDISTRSLSYDNTIQQEPDVIESTYKPEKSDEDSVFVFTLDRYHFIRVRWASYGIDVCLP